MVRVIQGAKVCGYRRTSFTSQEGQQIQGYTVYFTYPLVVADGNVGEGVGSCYLSIQAFAESGVDVGEEIPVVRNGRKFDYVG